MATAAPLYTPEILALATSLAAWPMDPALTGTGEARSRSCGSMVTVGLTLSPDGLVERIGLRAHACAIGQAAAAVFAEHAPGCSRRELAAAEQEIANWLAGNAALPSWPGFAVLAAARGYPGRHGAIPLAWKAALAALPTA